MLVIAVARIQNAAAFSLVKRPSFVWSSSSGPCPPLLLLRRTRSTSTQTALFSTQSKFNATELSISSSSSLLAQEDNEEEDSSSSSMTSLLPLYRSEGLFAVEKPANWTSNDVVSYLRGILEKDARQRGAKPQKVGRRRKRSIKVGHGGTLDPLATGVLVIGVGKGTKELQSYLQGAKRYTAGIELGFETTTLDMDGDVTKTAPYEHVTWEQIQKVVPTFIGSIQQTPPIYSAIRKDGKRLYEQAREGFTAEDLQLEARTVQVYELNLKNSDTFPPKLEIDVACGGGTYIRSLVRDLGLAVDTVATTTFLRRTQHGPFVEKDCIPQEEWTVENIVAAIDRFNHQQQ